MFKFHENLSETNTPNPKKIRSSSFSKFDRDTPRRSLKPILTDKPLHIGHTREKSNFNNDFSLSKSDNSHCENEFTLAEKIEASNEKNEFSYQMFESGGFASKIRVDKEDFKFSRDLKGGSIYLYIIASIILNIFHLMLLISMFFFILSILPIQLMYPVAVIWVPVNIYMVFKVIEHNSYIDNPEKETLYDAITNIPIIIAQNLRKKPKIYRPLLFIYICFIAFGIFSTTFIIWNLIESEFYSRSLIIFGNLCKLIDSLRGIVDSFSKFLTNFNLKFLDPLKEALNTPLSSTLTTIFENMETTSPGFIDLLKRGRKKK